MPEGKQREHFILALHSLPFFFLVSQILSIPRVPEAALKRGLHFHKRKWEYALFNQMDSLNVEVEFLISATSLLPSVVLSWA